MSMTSTSKVSGANSLRTSNIRNARVNSRRNDDIESVETADAISADVAIQKENEQSFDTFKKDNRQRQEQPEEAANFVSVKNVSMTTIEVMENIEEIDEANTTTKRQVDVYGTNQKIIRKQRNPNDNYAKHFFEKNELIEEVDEFA